MISVFLDTSILHCSDAKLDEVRFIKKLQRIVDEIEVNDIYTEVKIVIPKIVLGELFEQQIEAYEEWIDKLQDVKLPNMHIDCSFDYDSYFDDLFKKEINSFKQQLVRIEVADFPTSCLENIIYRALRKEPPFEGKTKRSDKGFKDVVVWETLKEYKNKHINETLVLHCADNLLASSNLEREYNTEFRDKIYMVNKDELIPCLAKLLDTEMVDSFEKQLERRIIDTLSEENEIFYELFMENNTWGDGDIIDDFLVKSVNVLHCIDEKRDNRIVYDIEIYVDLKYTQMIKREDYKMGGFRNLTIFYDFVKDEFMIKEYDNLVLNRSTFKSYYSLTNN